MSETVKRIDRCGTPSLIENPPEEMLPTFNSVGCISMRRLEYFAHHMAHHGLRPLLHPSTSMQCDTVCIVVKRLMRSIRSADE